MIMINLEGKMDLTNDNICMFIICFVAIIFLFFIKPLKFIFKLLFKLSFGLAAIYFINMILFFLCDTKKFCVGLNFFSSGVAFILGLPGIFFLYVLKFIL